MTQSPPPVFGERLQRYRARAGLTQEGLAERAGLTATTISALERGVRRLPFSHTRLRLAEALELSDAERASFVASPRGDARGAATPPPARPPTNLPAERSPLIGRADALVALSDL